MMRSSPSLQTLLTFIFMLLLSCTQAFARDMEWQKIELEQLIENKYNQELGALLNNRDFIIKADIKYNDPGMPNFEDLNQADVKVSDIDFDESKGDYIAFSKVGLEVPLVDKFFKEHQRKLKELYRYGESYNIFKNIEGINIKVVLSENLEEPVVEAAKNIVNNIKLSFGNVQPRIEYQTAKIDRPIEQKDAGAGPAAGAGDTGGGKVGWKEILEFIGRFGNAIGMILATILFFWLAMKLLQKYMDLMAEKDKQKKEMEGAAETAAAEAEAQAAEQAIQEFTPTYSFERFLKFWKINPEQTILMIKRWNRIRNDELKMALQGVAQQMEQEDLAKVFSRLNPIERDNWKSCLDHYLEDAELERSNRIITEEVIREMVSGSFVSDYELIDILLNIELDVARKFVLKDKQNGKVLMNLLNPQITSKILDDMSAQQMSEVVRDSLDFDFKQITDDFKGFKKVLKEYCDRESGRPFNHKIIQMIPAVDPEKEELLYGFLANANKKNEIIEAARENFPSALIMRLPKEFLKFALQNYPLEKKVQLLLSIEPELKTELLGTFAEEGSAARDLMNMEFEAIENDEVQMARLKRSKGDIWKSFVVYVRDTIKQDKGFASEIDNLVRSWAVEICQQA